jgi:hypothetical protein
LSGKSDGTFTDRKVGTDLIPHSSGSSLAVGDVNDDGVPDLAGANGDLVSVLLARGDGTFDAEAVPMVVNEVRAVTFDTSAGGHAKLVVVTSVNTCPDGG